jgi:phosphate transport system substrate-binding protein
MANASRPMKEKEIAECQKNGVKDIAEFMVGYDGIVLANLKSRRPYHLTRKQIFLALARVISDAQGKLIPNPYTHWQQIDAALPNVKIAIYGPPPTSGTRDAFVEMVMEAECKDDPAFIHAFPDETHRKEQCKLLREDGHFIDAGENDNIIVQKLKHDADALGLFGFSFLEQNADALQASIVDGIAPEMNTIASGEYPISRSLYVYVKEAHYKKIVGLKAFVAEINSEECTGAEGYLTLKGLIPAP